MFFFIIFFVLFGIYIAASVSYKNPYKLYMVFGKKGSGKSSFLVKQALKYYKKGYIIYTNMQDMLIPGVRYIDGDQLGDFVPEQNSLLLLDEVGMLFDNRNYKNFKNSTRDFFKLQRHYHVIVYLASQTFDIDKKLRDLTDMMYLVLHVGAVSIAKPIVRKVVLTESVGDQESRISENLKFKPPWNWKFTWLPGTAKYFDSFQVPDMPKLPFTSPDPAACPAIPKDFKERIAVLLTKDAKKAVKTLDPPPPTT